MRASEQRWDIGTVGLCYVVATNLTGFTLGAVSTRSLAQVSRSASEMAWAPMAAWVLRDFQRVGE